MYNENNINRYINIIRSKSNIKQESTLLEKYLAFFL